MFKEWLPVDRNAKSKSDYQLQSFLTSFRKLNFKGRHIKSYLPLHVYYVVDMKTVKYTFRFITTLMNEWDTLIIESTSGSTYSAELFEQENSIAMKIKAEKVGKIDLIILQINKKCPSANADGHLNQLYLFTS